jgi:hypothetical protein
MEFRAAVRHLHLAGKGPGPPEDGLTTQTLTRQAQMPGEPRNLADARLFICRKYKPESRTGFGVAAREFSKAQT